MIRYPIEPTELRDRLWARVGYKPWAGQREFHDVRSPRHPWAPARWRLLCAGARYGKSRAGGMEALAYVMTPGTRTWCVGPTYDLASREFRYVIDSIQTLRSQGLKIPITRLQDNPVIGQMHLEIDHSPNPSRPDPALKSMLRAKSWKEPATLLGEELDLLILCEGSQCQKIVWERYLRARLGTRLGRMVIPTTPAGIDDFLYPLFYEPWARHEPDFWVGQYGVWDNPAFDRDEIEEARKSLDPTMFAEQYGGEFVSFSGRVYKDFERKTHVVEAFEVPRDWPRWRCIDYGYEDPFACLWVAGDENGRLVVYREHYKKRLILSEHARLIKEATAAESIDYTVIDPTAAGKRLETGISILQHLAELGVPSIPGNNDMEAGIFRMMEWLKVDPASGKPGLVVMNHCFNTIREFESYRWREVAVGRRAEIKPEDRNNHALDPLRYLLLKRPRRFVEREKQERFSFRRYKEIARGLERGQGADIIGRRHQFDSRPSW